MFNKILAFLLLVAVFIPTCIVIGQTAFEVNVPVNGDTVALVTGVGLITLVPLAIIRLFRSK